MKSIKILFIATSHDKMGNTNNKTGVWLEEVAAPYYIFKDEGASITLASPRGGPVPLDPKSQSIMVATSATKRFLKDDEAMNFLSQSVLLENINADDFDVVFLPGGHGALWDITNNKIVKQLLEAFNSKNKAIGAVSHEAVGLLLLQNQLGDALVKGKQLTACTNSEEESSGLTSIVPVLLETELLSLGALFSKAADYTSYVVTDGNIITGQNSASSEAVVKNMVAYVRTNRPLQKPRLVINEIL